MAQIRQAACQEAVTSMPTAQMMPQTGWKMIAQYQRARGRHPIASLTVKRSSKFRWAPASLGRSYASVWACRHGVLMHDGAAGAAGSCGRDYVQPFLRS